MLLLLPALLKAIRAEALLAAPSLCQAVMAFPVRPARLLQDTSTSAAHVAVSVRAACLGTRVIWCQRGTLMLVVVSLHLLVLVLLLLVLLLQLLLLLLLLLVA